MRETGLAFDWFRIDSSEEPTHMPNNRNDHTAIWGNVNDTTFANFTYNPLREEVGINPDIIGNDGWCNSIGFFFTFFKRRNFESFNN